MLLSHGRYVLLGMVAALAVAAGGALALAPPGRAAAGRPEFPNLTSGVGRADEDGRLYYFWLCHWVAVEG